MTENAKRLQALLFVAGEPVPLKELAEILDVSAEALMSVSEELTREMAEQGLRLVWGEGEIELVTSPEMGEWLSMVARQEPVELSRAGAETLAVVAYGGPFTRYEIDTIRGVDSRQMIRRLLQQGMLKRFVGRGRAPRYDISEEFLKHVGITRREDLPEYYDTRTHPTL